MLTVRARAACIATVTLEPGHRPAAIGPDLGQNPAPFVGEGTDLRWDGTTEFVVLEAERSELVQLGEVARYGA